MNAPRYYVVGCGGQYVNHCAGSHMVLDAAWAHRVVFAGGERAAHKVCNRLNADEEKWEQAA